MKNKFPSIVNMGLTSIITIFLVLALAIFASLSLLTAQSDYELSKASADRLKQITLSNNQGEEFLKKIDVSCVKSYNSLKTPDLDSYNANIQAQYENDSTITCQNSENNLEISTDISINDTQVLHITAVPTLPKNDGDAYYKVTQWKVQKITDWKMDDSLPLYTPSDKK